MSNFLLSRKPVTALVDELRQLTIPVLIVVGDQDYPAFESSVLIRRHARYSALAVFPFTGHTLNIEEPMLFNSLLDQFLSAVDSGRGGSWSANK